MEPDLLLVVRGVVTTGGVARLDLSDRVVGAVPMVVPVHVKVSGHGHCGRRMREAHARRREHDRAKHEGRAQKARHTRECRPVPLQRRHCRLFASPSGDLALSPRGGYPSYMSEPLHHATHPGLVKRLKRADGHLRHVIGMIEDGAPCSDIAVQIQAVEKAISAAKRTLIHDHIDHCLSDGAADLAELRALTKLL
jgi:DNA-binding FrmR family transcriptional regulator